MSIHKITLNDVPIEWNLDNGALTFFGIDSTLFWNNPSLFHLLKPLADEIGYPLFRLLIAHASSFGMEDDYESIITKFSDNFEEGFLLWSRSVAAAGWGEFSISKIDYEKKMAKVVVKNPWELRLQLPLDYSEKTWGCPFLQGKLIGIFKQVFSTSVWADESITMNPDELQVEFIIYQSKKTIEKEIHTLRLKSGDKEKKHIETKAEEQLLELKAMSETLEVKVLERMQELSDQKQTFEDLFYKAAAGISLLNERGFIDCNDAFLNLFGYESKKDIYHKQFHELAPRIQPDGRKSSEKVAEMMKLCMLEGSNQSQFLHIKSTGETFWVNIILTKITISGEHIIHAYLQDITKQKQLEEDTTKQHAMLLEQSKFAQMGELIGMIAHQWKQPLNIIGLTLTKAETDKALGLLDDEEFYNLTKRINDQVIYMSQTIDDFRHFFKQDKKSEKLSIVSLINDSMNLLGSVFGKQGITVKIEIDETLSVNVFSNEFKQVVLNILNNAKDALSERKTKEKKEIRISTREDKKWIHLLIEDNAGGIDPNIINKVFDPYFTTKPDSKGTGIGLYISKTIVEEHLNGKVEVKNGEKGAVFDIKLPKNNVSA